MTRLTRYCLTVALRGAPLLVLAALSCSCSTRGAWNMSSSAVTSNVTSGSRTTGSHAVGLVSCSDGKCSVTMGGRGTSVGILDTTVSFEDITDGRATLRVADQDVSCATGQTFTAGPLTLTCTDVTAETVSFTASRR